MRLAQRLNSTTVNVVAMACALAATYGLATTGWIGWLSPSVISSILLLYLAALALNVAWGYAGQLSLVYPAIEAVAAFSFALLAIHGWAIYMAALAGIVIASFASLIVSLALHRLTGIQYAMATFGIGLGTTQLLSDLNVTGGASGLVVANPYLGLPSWLYNNNSGSFDLAALVVVSLVVAAAVDNLARSGRGYGLKAMREDATQARGLGVSVGRNRHVVAVLAAVVAGLAGVLYVVHIKAIDPGSLSISALGFNALLAVIIGGRGTFWGPLVGATFVTLGVTVFPWPSYLSYVALGVVTIGVIILFPKGVIGSLAPGAGRVRRVHGATSRAVNDTDPVMPPRFDDRKKRLTATGMTKRYGVQEVVSSVDFEILLDPAEVVGMAGPNGAGKSTLLSMLSGATACSAGTVFLDSAELPRLEEKRVTHGVTRVAQDTDMFPELTALENVFVALSVRHRAGVLGSVLRLSKLRQRERDDVKQASALLSQFGLDEYADVLAKDLSFGNRRLLAITAAVATSPRVLLMDEPSAGLSPASISRLLAYLQLLESEGLALVVVDHRLDFLDSLTTKIVMMANGRILSSGTLAEHAKHQDVVSAYLGALGSEGHVVVKHDSVLELERTELNPNTVLAIERVCVGYDGKEVLSEVSIDVKSNRLVGWLGPNGAGKTTLALAVVGAVPLQSGQIKLSDKELGRASPAIRARKGVVLVPAGRRVARSMTVQENLEIAIRASRAYPRGSLNAALEVPFALFPVLSRYAKRPAGRMSGGEIQMLAVARGLVLQPKVLFLDEAFAGLSPKVCDDLAGALVEAAVTVGTSLVIIDQDVSRVASFVQELCLFASGRLQVSGPTAKVTERADLFERFLGFADERNESPSLLDRLPVGSMARDEWDSPDGS